jgi:hypothetical protein
VRACRAETDRAVAGPAAIAGRGSDTSPRPAGASGGLVAVPPGMPLRVPAAVLDETFAQFRSCGRGRAECQVLWIGPWSDPTLVTTATHPVHRAHRGGFELDDAWLTQLWRRLSTYSEGIRAQVHTHPREAFHSATDDAWPVIHLEGFLSLVIPDFATGPVGLDRSYLAEIGPDGEFHEAELASRLLIV